jgi:DNA-binding GntR family transcriptional regulator
MTTGLPKHPSAGIQRTRKRRTPNARPRGLQTFGSSLSVTNAGILHKKLRDEIIAMKLVPGTPINEKDIAQEHGVSRTPVREAILRLADERLVEVIPKSGTYVARIPLSALPEALVVRRALEGVTVRSASRFATASQITGLYALIQRQQEAAELEDLDAFHKADEDYHAGIAAAGGYAGIWDLIQQVKVQVDRYRQLTLPQEGRMPRIIDEHLNVLRAIEAGEGEVAVQHMENHLNKLRSEIAEFRDIQPDYFIYDIELDDELMK